MHGVESLEKGERGRKSSLPEENGKNTGNPEKSGLLCIAADEKIRVRQ